LVSPTAFIAGLESPSSVDEIGNTSNLGCSRAGSAKESTKCSLALEKKKMAGLKAREKKKLRGQMLE
jgi:hypothetical protein